MMMERERVKRRLAMIIVFTSRSDLSIHTPRARKKHPSQWSDWLFMTFTYIAEEHGGGEVEGLKGRQAIGSVFDVVNIMRKRTTECPAMSR
jgi:hypothetical protein